MSEQRALPIGVVGLGQCGGNLAAIFAARGYPALAVNTSHADLRQVADLPPEQRLAIDADGVNGTGGNAEVGAHCLEARRDEVVSVAGELPGAEILLAAAGLGGGTGASLPALVAALAGLGRPVVALAALPASAEPYAAKANALQAVNALLDAPFEALVLLDNQQLARVHGGAGMDQFYGEGNRALAEGLDAWNRLPADPGLAPIRTFDPEALRQTLLSGGVVVFGGRPLEAPLSPEALLAAAQAVVADHPCLGSGYALEDGVVISAVLVMDADTLADTPAQVIDGFSQGLKEAGGGAVIHLGLYRGEVEGPALHVMVGGLPLPKRVQALLEEASEEAARIAAKPAARARLQKLDLSGLALPTGRAPLPPSTKGKGMVRSKPAAAEGAPPLVDLDFEDGDAPVVEEEIVDDFVPGGEVTGVHELGKK